MSAVVVVLALVVVAQAACLILSNRNLQASNAELVRAVVAKDGRELATMNRIERRPAPPAAAETPARPPTEAELLQRIEADIAAVEGSRVMQPVGFDGT